MVQLLVGSILKYSHQLLIDEIGKANYSLACPTISSVLPQSDWEAREIPTKTSGESDLLILLETSSQELALTTN